MRQLARVTVTMQELDRLTNCSIRPHSTRSRRRVSREGTEVEREHRRLRLGRRHSPRAGGANIPIPALELVLNAEGGNDRQPVIDVGSDLHVATLVHEQGEIVDAAGILAIQQVVDFQEEAQAPALQLDDA